MATRLDRLERLPDQVTITHGPATALARLFLKADKAVRDRGIYLSLSTDFEALFRVKKAHSDSGNPLAPHFNPEYGFDGRDAYWIAGRDRHGEVALTLACRLFVWPETTLREEMESLRFFYPDPKSQAAAEERWEVTAPAARHIRGRVIYSGGTWVRPDFRGTGLTSIVPRISRAYAFTRWNPDFYCAIVQDALVKKGLAEKFGYSNVEWSIKWTHSPFGDLLFALIWMTREEIIDDILAYETQAQPSAEVAPRPARSRMS